MALLPTIVSVLAVWAFLAVLVLGLLLVMKTLQSIRGYLEKVAMGVRAIETQTGLLGHRAEALARAMAETAPAARSAARALGRLERRAAGAVGAVRGGR
jgi:hypothetical protein